MESKDALKVELLKMTLKVLDEKKMDLTVENITEVYMKLSSVFFIPGV